MQVEARHAVKCEAEPDTVSLSLPPVTEPAVEVVGCMPMLKTTTTSSSSNDSVNNDEFGASNTPRATGEDARKRPPTLVAYHQQRYDRFVQAYFGYGAEQRAKCVRQASQLCMIGLGLQKKCQGRNTDAVHAMRLFLRHSVLAVEGDAVFVKLVQRARPLWGEEEDHHFDDPRQWPNARCIALHYGLPSAPTGVEKQQQQFPQTTLMAVVATTPIEEGEAVRLCLRSYHRCLDEAAWYEQLVGAHGVNEGEVAGTVTRGRKRFDMWPEGLAFYHGVGSRHAGMEPVVGFPFTLLDLAEATMIGEGEKGLFAAHPVPYATCFLYSGPVVATKVVEARRECIAVGGTSLVADITCTTSGTNTTTTNTTSASAPSAGSVSTDEILTSDISIDDATYALGLGRHGLCFGQGLMRYANHRYNLSNFGNVELCSVMLSVTSEFSSLAAELERRRNGATRARKRTKRRGAPRRRPDKSCPLDARTGDNDAVVFVKKRRYRPLVGRRIFLEEHSHFVTIPFFIATTDIEVGQQLLAWTYGEEYDARLERQVVCDGHLVPYANAAVLDARRPTGRWQRYKGDYRHGMGAGDIVWCPQPGLGVHQDPTEELFVIMEMPPRRADYVLLRSIARSHAYHQALHRCGGSTDDEMLLFEVCEAKALERCVIAHTDSVALLLGDMDYWTVREPKRTTTPPPLAGKDCSCGGGPSCVIHHIVVNATALRVAARLVLESECGAAVATTLLSGRVWPFLCECDGVTGRSGRKVAVRRGKKRETAREVTSPLS
ncbi:hypothetical protein DQ04_00791160 [Trypanosoma grayi]|uniref:hypothetical protein n=1 Tax=Trypanosoma grayi TaxID=71804 RepID=UPI0004F43D26|nr:hypothetical protein DQ04_00791160 [Trypanosoma grayi]KEG13786.1 hypothetical protein DQ04_00791160 [Trypanosoma grayi]